MIRIPCAVSEEIILPIVFAIDARELHHILQRVTLSRVTPIQPELIPAILNFYRQRVRMTDESGALPYGICFADSPTIYLTNGHHRWYVCRERGRKQWRMWVHHHPLTLRDAILATQPVIPVVHKLKRAAAPVASYRQMQFPLFA